MKQDFASKIEEIVVSLNGLEVKGVQNMAIVIGAIQKLGALKTALSEMEEDGNGNGSLCG